MPGAGKQSPAVQEQIKELLEAGFDPTTIHRRLKVGRSSIYRMKRCLQQHGTAYMPSELNKKNGRPKVLTAEQELEVHTWLAKPENRTRYLDDLVWLCHDTFGIVCSTTTMSKLKRKWLRVIEYEETGQPLDHLTYELLLETHPDLPILQDENAMPQGERDDGEAGWTPQKPLPPVPQAMMQAPPPPPLVVQMMQQMQPQQHPYHVSVPNPPIIEPEIDEQLEQQLQREIASVDS